MIKCSLLFALVSVASAAPSISEGVYTEAQAARGKKVYADQCADCHGDDLKGIKDATPLIGETFHKKWDGKTVGRLIDVTKRTMPTDSPGTLSRPICADLVAYILSENGYPAGKAELDSASPVVKEITIEPKK
jgi:mono/diheme cytochrome c family protein